MSPFRESSDDDSAVQFVDSWIDVSHIEVEKVYFIVMDNGVERLHNLDDKRKEICAICQDEITNLVIVDCGHPFCKSCINESYNIRSNNLCPSCREPLKRCAWNIVSDTQFTKTTMKQLKFKE